MASTPALSRGEYYELFNDPERQKVWHEIHVSIMEDPAVSPEKRARVRALCNELEWLVEQMAEFPEIGEGVFPKDMVTRAWREIDYALNIEAAEKEPRGERPPTRTLGVDWDKFNEDGRGCNLVILEAAKQGWRLVYRDEIPQGKFTLTNAVHRVVQLNEIFRPEHIFVDRGNGEQQVETLQKLGLQMPKSGLAKIVEGWQFAQLVELPDPLGGVRKEPFKAAMIGLLRKWFEDGQIEIARGDKILNKEFQDYHVEAVTERGIRYGKKNDHGISATGLAAMAMHLRVRNPYAAAPATQGYVVPNYLETMLANAHAKQTGIPVGSRGSVYETGRNGVTERNPFQRGGLGSTPGSRSSF